MDHIYVYFSALLQYSFDHFNLFFIKKHKLRFIIMKRFINILYAENALLETYATNSNETTKPH